MDVCKDTRQEKLTLHERFIVSVLVIIIIIIMIIIIIIIISFFVKFIAQTDVQQLTWQ